MALYVVQSGKTACASNASKIAASLATGSAVTNKIVAFDCTFDGTDATKTPIRVELVKTTTAPSVSGAAFTPLVVSADTSRTAQTTARTNDTTDGSSPTVIAAWEVSPTAGISYQWPLGREPNMPVSAFWEIRVTTVTASGTPNYDVNLWFEE